MNTSVFWRFLPLFGCTILIFKVVGTIHFTCTTMISYLFLLLMSSCPRTLFFEDGCLSKH